MKSGPRRGKLDVDITVLWGIVGTLLGLEQIYYAELCLVLLSCGQFKHLFHKKSYVARVRGF